MSFLKNGFRERVDKLSYEVPWGVITRKSVVFNTNESMQITLRFRGHDVDSLTNEEKRLNNKGVNNILKRLPTGYIVYFENSRHSATNYEKSRFTSPLLNEIEDEREAFFQKDRLYENYFYMTILYKLPKDNINAFFKIFESGITDNPLKALKPMLNSALYTFFPYLVKKTTTEVEVNSKKIFDEFAELEEKFLENINLIKKGLQPFFSELEILSPKDTLSYLHNTVSDHNQKIGKIPTAFLSSYLCDSNFLGGHELRLGNKYMSVISILDFPSMTEPYILDCLNNLEMNYRFVTRYIALGKDEAIKEIKSRQKIWGQQSKPLFTMMVEAFTKQEAQEVDENALNLQADSTTAYEEVAEDLVGYGYYTMTIVLMHEDKEILKENCAKTISAIHEKGFLARVESDNATNAWFGSIPACYKYNIRRYLVNSLNLSHLAPTSSRWSGDRINKHFNDKSLITGITTGKIPFHLNLHVNDVGHTAIFGPTGSGKSVLLNTIACQFKKYLGCKVFIFDKSASSRVLTKAVGGNFYNMLVDKTLAFQPLANIEEDNEKTFCQNWLCNYLESENVVITPKDKQAIWQALVTMAEKTEKNQRTISNFCQIIQNESIRLGLQSLTKKGAYGSLFDSNEDRFGSGNWQVFEMETLMNTPNIVAPTLDYIFHRIEQQLTGEKAIIILDECWLFLANPIFREKIKEYFKDMRKKNCSIVFATQNISDVSEKKDLLNTIMENCPTKIYLPNTSATNVGTRDTYIMLGLNSKQIELISDMQRKREYYYTSELGNRVFELALQPIELAFLTATSKLDQKQVNELEEQNLSAEEFCRYWREYKNIA